MPIVQAKCIACNGNLEVDSQKEAAVCPFCGTPYIVEKAINHFHAASTKIESFHADVVNISAESQLETLVKSGETFIMLNKFSDARRVFDEITRKYPQDYRGWWGLIKVDTENLTRVKCSEEELEKYKSFLNNIYTVSSQNIHDEINAEYNKFMGKVEKYRREKQIKTKQLTAERDTLVTILKDEIAMLQDRKRRQIDIHNVVAWVYITFAAITIIGGAIFSEVSVWYVLDIFAVPVFLVVWYAINNSPKRPYNIKQAEYDSVISVKEKRIDEAYNEYQCKINVL